MQLTLSSYGARIRIDAPRDVLEEVERSVELVAQPATGRAHAAMEVCASSDGSGVVSSKREVIKTSTGRAGLVDAAVDHLHTMISRQARGVLFVHAGVVSWDDTVLLLPGRSGVGKSTLVQAALRRGATYHSDEFAVVDDRGRVHPFARSLRLRDERGVRSTVTPDELGCQVATGPVEPTVMLATQFDRGSLWQPVPLRTSHAAVLLVDNTVRARTKPESAVRVASALSSFVQAFGGPRGDALETIDRVIAEVGVEPHRRIQPPS